MSVKNYTEKELLAEAKKNGFKVSSVLELTPDMFKKSGEKAGNLNISVLSNVKNMITKGKAKVSDYASIAEPFAQSTAKLLKSWSGINADYAKEARLLGDELTKFADIGANSDGGYKYDYQDFKLPFSRTEYAKLPTAVLPTQKDVDTGIIARDSMPFQRLQDPTGGGTDAQGNPIPADINLGSDRGAIELESQRQATQLQGTLDQQKALRDTNRAQLAELLAQQQTESFNRAVPQLAEHANTKGILRSTGFGDLLAQKYTDLTKDTQMQLGQQGLADSEKYVGGLGDIANVRAGLQTSGLQREFSLDDASRSESLARELAQLSKPTEGGGKSSGEKWAQGVTAGGTLIGGLAGAKK